MKSNRPIGIPLKSGGPVQVPRPWPADPVNQLHLSIRDFVLQMLLNGVGNSELLGLVPVSLEKEGIEVLVASRTVYGVKAAILANVIRWPGQTEFELVRASDFEQDVSVADDERRLLNPEVVVRFSVLGDLRVTK